MWKWNWTHRYPCPRLDLLSHNLVRLQFELDGVSRWWYRRRCFSSIHSKNWPRAIKFWALMLYGSSNVRGPPDKCCWAAAGEPRRIWSCLTYRFIEFAWILERRLTAWHSSHDSMVCCYAVRKQFTNWFIGATFIRIFSQHQCYSVMICLLQGKVWCILLPKSEYLHTAHWNH